MQLRRIEVHLAQIARGVALASSLKWGDDGWPLSPPAVTALACTSRPNSTTATKLLPLVPYHFFVPGYGRALKEASEPQAEDVKPTGMLGRRVAERLDDVAGEALESIDVAPGRLPGPEVCFQFARTLPQATSQ